MDLGRGDGYTYIALSILIFVVVYIFMTWNNGKGGQKGVGVQVEEQGFEVLDEPDPGEEITLGEVVVKKDGEKALKASKKDDPGGKDKVVKQRSDIDGEYYYVSASLGEKKKAADKLAEVHRRAQYLLQAIDDKLDRGGRVKAKDGVDITDNMRKLVTAHYKKTIPFAEYYNPDDKTVGSNSDKGMLIEVCLRNKYKPTEWNSDNTLFRVHVHELAHSADHHFRGDGDKAHGPDFFRLHNYLLGVSEDLGIYNCAEYKKSGGSFCGLKLTEEANCG